MELTGGRTHAGPTCRRGAWAWRLSGSMGHPGLATGAEKAYSPYTHAGFSGNKTDGGTMTGVPNHTRHSCGKNGVGDGKRRGLPS